MFPEIERRRFSEAVSLLSQGLDSLRSLGMTMKRVVLASEARLLRIALTMKIKTRRVL
jgi:hypothetical protein